MTRLDPVTGEITATITLDLGVTDLAASDDAVWITHKDDGMVSRIDPATNAVVATIETGAGAHDLAIDDNGVWISNYQANTVSRIDPATNTVVATIEGVGSGVGITAGDGDIFVSTMSEGISRIDPATNEARAVVDLEGWIYGLAYGDGELWATNTDRRCRVPARRNSARSRRGMTPRRSLRLEVLVLEDELAGDERRALRVLDHDRPAPRGVDGTGDDLAAQLAPPSPPWRGRRRRRR